MKYIIIACLLFSPLAFADTLEQAEKFATAVGTVYVAMPKEALYKVFTPLQQKGYYKEGAEEWIIFSGWTTEESGDTVTFYLKDNKVKGWDK